MYQSLFLILLPVSAIMLAIYMSETHLSQLGVWRSYGALTIIGKIIWLILFLGPYIGSYFLLRHLTGSSLDSWDDYVSSAVIYFICLLICLAPLFAMLVLLSGTQESFTIKSIDVPVIVGTETNYKIERHPATEGINTPFNTVIWFNLMLWHIWFGLACFIALPAIIYAVHFS